MRAHLATIATLTLLAAGCTASVNGSVTPKSSTSPSASTSPAASATPGATASAAVTTEFQAQKTFDTDSFKAKLDGKDAPMSKTADRVVQAYVKDMVALTLGKVMTALPVGQHQVVFSFIGNEGKHAAMPTFTTGDLKTVGWQFFEGNGGFTPKGYMKTGTTGTETITFSGGKLNVTINTDIKATVDFTNKEPVRKLELTIVDFPM